MIKIINLPFEPSSLLVVRLFPTTLFGDFLGVGLGDTLGTFLEDFLGVLFGVLFADFLAPDLGLCETLGPS